MNVKIANNLIDKPTGGGNQFLKSLKEELVKLGMCSDNQPPDIVLFNSHQNLEQVFNLKRDNPGSKFIHRLDGPMRLYNKMTDQRDRIAYEMNNYFADAVVFQSEYSREANLELGLDIGNKENVIIHNSPGKDFYPSEKANKGEKTRIIASSWSDNIRKGFLTYEFMDNNLDFNKYEFSFMGRTPIEFKNIKCLGPLETRSVAEELRRSDIFITASENDPCSNSLIEALSCGLPAIYLKSGGHPELVKDAGISFENKEEIFNKLEYMCDNYLDFRDKIEVESMSLTAKRYVEFFKSIISRA